jgi:hypothetical protein
MRYVTLSKQMHRFHVFTTVKMWIVVFLVMKRVVLCVVTNASEGNVVSIFRSSTLKMEAKCSELLK